MKYLLCNWTHIDEIRGGCETAFSKLGEFLKESGHEAKPVSFNHAKNTLGIGIEKSSAGFFEVEASHIIDRYCSLYTDLFPDTRIISNAGVTNFWYKHQNVVNIFNDPYGAIIQKLSRLGLCSVSTYNKFGNILVLMQKGSASGATNIAVSDFMANEMGKMGIQADRTIPHGVDLDAFRPMDKEALREKYSIPKDAIVGVWSKGFEPVAGFGTVSHLVKNFKDVFWVLNFKFGGDYEPKAKNVKIIKSVGHNLMPEIYNLADFCVNPSLVESFGLVPLEAMACGLPCVLSNTGFVWEEDLKEEVSVPTEYGVLVNSWRSKEFEKAVKMVLKGSFNPRKFAGQYDMDRWKSEWRKVMG